MRTDASFAAVLDAARRDDWPPDLIVISGDIAQDERAATYRRLAAILEDLNVPVLTLPGNHDAPEHMRAHLDSGAIRYCRPAALGNWRILPLSTHVEGKVGGRLDDGQLESLRNELAQPGEHYHLVFLHHHPIATGSRWLDGIGLDNADEFLAIIDGAKSVRGVFWGHVHQHAELRRGNVLFASTPSTCAQFLPHNDTFAMDSRPPAYRWIELAAEGALDTHVQWLAAADVASIDASS